MSGQPSPDLAAARTQLRVFGGGVVDLGDRYAVQIARAICSSNKEQVPVVVGYFRPAARAWEGTDGTSRHCPDWAAAVGPRRGRAAAGEELDDRIWGELPEGD